LKLFIVDDSKLVRERLTELLIGNQDVELVGEAATGGYAIQAIKRLRPDVVTLDIHLPDGNGLEILESIKANDTPPVVIMLTAFPYPQYREKCRAAGAEYFLDKMIDFDQFEGVIHQIQQDVGSGVRDSRSKVLETR
jgi:DNA-binding NarL/FixJ family response regulator